MKYKYKLEIKENDVWIDYTEFCLQPFTLKDLLDETLSTMSVKMYLAREEAMVPSSPARFTIFEFEVDKYTQKDMYDFVINTDNVYKEVISDREYNAHEITFIEPIALLQKYTVDNIALTYQLEDMVQYLDTGALKKNVQLVFTKDLRSEIDVIPDGTSFPMNLYYTYAFDPSPYTSSDGTQHKGLNEWSKIIYFKDGELYRIDKNGNEVVAGFGSYPYIPYCPLWVTEYNPSTNQENRFQLAYDVYAEIMDLTTGKVIMSEKLIKTVDLYKDDDRQFYGANGSSGPFAVTGIDYGDKPAAKHYAIKSAFKPKNELTVAYINSDRTAYQSVEGSGVQAVYYWFPVQPNRRYNLRYVRNRNAIFTDGQEYAMENVQKLSSGLPTNCYYYTTAAGEVVIKKAGTGACPLQFPELRYSFDVLDVSGEAGQIDVAIPTPNEYKHKYNCYDYLLKAFYATGSYKEDNPLPFSMTDEVRRMLQMTPIYECQNAGNTLYDVCLYIGRYIHAIPYCSYGNDGLLYLDFLPLGRSDITPVKGHATSVYNSRNLAEYLSSFDSYVNNLANNDSTVEEILCAKSDDGSSLVYADNAILKLTRPCYGIEAFYVAKRNAPTEWKSLLKNKNINGASFICEKSIYEILDFRAHYTPNKGCCLYYTLGDDKICGLQYKRPNPISSGEENTSIQNIIGRIWWHNTVASEVNVNDYIFKIRYRTYDETRVRLFRPDLSKFLCNTKNDYCPMQRSYRSQTEKVINSDFYGRNLVGELKRTGNEVKQRDLLVEHYDDLPKTGDLQNIDGIPHYVNEITVPFYNEYISVSVIYSKDFQRLSSIVSIPAENRFYEIATKGIIRRSVAKDEFVIIDTETHTQTGELSEAGRSSLMKRILSHHSPPIRYAVVTFKNRESNSQKWSINIVKPVHVFSMNSSLGLSIEMDDNYSAGSQLVSSKGFNFNNVQNIAGAFNTMGSDIASLYASALLNTNINASARSYRALLPVRYCDKFGNADLYDLTLYGEQEMSVRQIEQQPVYIDNFQTPLFSSKNNELRKDNREAIKFVPQFNAIAGKNGIIIGSGFWKEKKKAVKCFSYTKQLNDNDELLPSGGKEVDFSYDVNTGIITLNAVPEDCLAIAFGHETADGDIELVFGVNERTTCVVLSFVNKII